MTRSLKAEELNDFLAPTLGYLVYQEQIIEFLHKFCGFTMGEADIVRRGFANLDRHISNLQSFGQSVIVCFNKYSSDTEEEINMVKEHCATLGIPFALNNAFAEGGNGAIELANLVVETIEKNPSGPLQFTYSDEQSICEKIESVAKKISD